MNSRRLVVALSRLAVVFSAALAGACSGQRGTPSAVSSATFSVTPLQTSSRPDGAEFLFAPDPPASAQNPTFSPTGQTLLVTLFHGGYNAGPAGLNLLPVAGDVLMALLDEEGQDSVNLPGSSWNAVTNRITFASDRQGADEIWTMAAGGSDLFRVTRHTMQVYYLEPSFSPDGQWIVFEAEAEAPADRQQGSIWKVRADGIGLIQLTDGPGGGTDDRQPNWSPAGDRILFQRRAPGSEDWNLYSLAPDGSEVRPITTAPSSDTDASWSPDGQWIVYSSDYGGLPVPNLFVIPAAGGTPRRVTHDDTHEDGAPSWSPDGKWIAFESHTGQAEDTPASVWRLAVPRWTVPSPPSLVPTPSFRWPDWARTARIAGAFFELSDSEAAIDARLDALFAENVSVVLADSPWGWSYSAWVDDAEFYAVRDLVALVIQKAHARGLKVVMYQTSLELTSTPDRNPGPEHPDWPQISLNGIPILFNDIRNDQEHWLDQGEWDLWVSPCSSYLPFSLNRVRAVVATGVDGLWVDTVYLQQSIGGHEDLWASTDPCSTASFRSATGWSMPTTENWDDPAWRRWVVWRQTQARDYLLAYKDAARAANPGLVFFEENWNVDSSGATQYANDPALYLPYPDMSTGHEVSTIADRIDEGQTGMHAAMLDEWLSFRTMLAFARAADRGKPSWILTYGYQPRDSAQMAGMVLAEGANYYETQGPGMAETVGETFRTQLFGWMAAHAQELYESESAAQVGLIFSPRNRDLLDSGSGNLYDVEDSTHFAAYRAAANLLYRAHVPFDVVLDTDTGAFSRYAVLILPEVLAMSDATAASLRDHNGRLLVVGDTGRYDEWLNERVENALSGVPQQHFSQIDTALVKAADTGLLSTDAPPEVQIGLRRTAEGYTFVLVNTAATPMRALNLDLRLRDGETAVAALRSTPDSAAAQDLALRQENKTVHLNVPTGMDPVALLALRLAASTLTPASTRLSQTQKEQ